MAVPLGARMGLIPTLRVRGREGPPHCGGEQTFTIYTTADGAYVALRPVCEALGLDVHSQRRRLQKQSWATDVMMTSVAADGKTREMTFIDRRTFTMWLATIDTGRISDEHTCELVRTYQCEAADALDKYFNEGAAMPPMPPEDSMQTRKVRRLFVPFGASRSSPRSLRPGSTPSSFALVSKRPSRSDAGSPTRSCRRSDGPALTACSE